MNAPHFIDAIGYPIGFGIREATALASQLGVSTSALSLAVSSLDADRIRRDFGDDAALYWDKPGLVVRTVSGPLQIVIDENRGEPSELCIARDAEPYIRVIVR